jgi:hypothetical protein
VPSEPQAHLVVPGKSHYGSESGVMASNVAPADAPMQAIRDALDVANPHLPAGRAARTYDDVRSAWDARTLGWRQRNREDANSTVVFYLHDRGGTPIDDCFIGFLDASVKGLDAEHPHKDQNILVAALQAVSDAILSRQPLHNDVQRGSYSFYVNEPTFNAMPLHQVTIEAHSGSGVVTYGPLNYRVDHATVGHMIYANQFTYVDISMPRITDASFVVYDTTTKRPDDEPTWPPFNAEGRIAPPAELGDYPPPAPKPDTRRI